MRVNLCFSDQGQLTSKGKKKRQDWFTPLIVQTEFTDSRQGSLYQNTQYLEVTWAKENQHCTNTRCFLSPLDLHWLRAYRNSSILASRRRKPDQKWTQIVSSHPTFQSPHVSVCPHVGCVCLKLCWSYDAPKKTNNNHTSGKQMGTTTNCYWSPRAACVFFSIYHTL